MITSFVILVEKFEICTILFSDIVTFTNIAAAVQPMDIVNMLNDLYSKFDALTNDNQVYKVRAWHAYINIVLPINHLYIHRHTSFAQIQRNDELI